MMTGRNSVSIRLAAAWKLIRWSQLWRSIDVEKLITVALR